MLQDKAAIVTGASRGIGRAAALALARAGARLTLHATGAERLAALAEEIAALGPEPPVIVAGDIAQAETAGRLAEATQNRFGRIDVLVNNAGINTRSATLDMPLDDWTRVLDVNLSGTLHACRAVLPAMIAAGGGKIVNVSSTTAKSAHRNAAPAYGASKAGVEYLTRHLAREMAPHGIHVNAISPGPVESDMTAQWSPEYRAQVLGGIPLGRLGRPEEIGNAILFLASPMSDFITGETINANGGTYMN